MLAAVMLAGRILFSGLPVPGATVTATHDGHIVTTTSDADGNFRLPDLDDGRWILRVQMRGFVDVTQEVVVPSADAPLVIALTMRPYAEIIALAGTPARAAPGTTGVQPDDDSADLDVINGSVVNGAATPFAQPRAFGNNRPRTGAGYTGLLSGVFADSAWNARPFAFGRALPPPVTGDAQLGFTLGGPLRIPGLVRNGPQMLLHVQHGVTRTASSAAAVMPTTAERRGEFSALQLPEQRISPQARALLAYYPFPNTVALAGANYLTALAARTRQHAFQFGLNSQAGRRTNIGGTVSWQRMQIDSSTLFGFRDGSAQSTVTAAGNWQRRLSTRASTRLRYQFTSASSTLTPFFANHVNVSADAGIEDNSQAPADWGPPSLSFPDVAGLSDANYQHNRSLTHTAGGDYLVRRGRHDVTIGGDLKHTSVDIEQQANPRGTLAFTGALTGIAFADFLLGVPATSTIGFGNPPARLNGATYDAYFNDDWRVNGVTLNLGARWEYETTFTDTAGYLDGAAHGSGSIEPRLGASWRPVPGSSLVVRGSYGIYRNLGLYQPLAALLLGQPPLSRAFSVQNTPEMPLSLAAPFPESVPSAKTFAADDAFRPGRVQNWALNLQRDLPGSLTVIASYLGARGASLTQASLPNSYPPGGDDPCSACPSGYVWLSSGGTSLRNSAQFTLRRRLHNGLNASAQYTLSKSTDDAATFGNTTLAPTSLNVAQNWRDLSAERGPSPFDQRHLVTAQVQYTTGVGVNGGTATDDIWGSIYKDWTVASQLAAGSGFPVTPISFVTVNGTGHVGIRPQLTGVPPLPATAGAYANSAAYTTPAPGTWGNAGRNSIRGPSQFGLDASVARVFRLRGRTSLEARVAATNVLNRVTFSGIDTTISSPQFARPTGANPMRRLQTTLRYRF